MHLTFEQARKEITVLNALIRAGVKIDESLSNDRAVEKGVANLLN